MIFLYSPTQNVNVSRIMDQLLDDYDKRVKPSVAGKVIESIEENGIDLTKVIRLKLLKMFCS